jgi:hypothetical protein
VRVQFSLSLSRALSLSLSFSIVLSPFVTPGAHAHTVGASSKLTSLEADIWAAVEQGKQEAFDEVEEYCARKAAHLGTYHDLLARRKYARLYSMQKLPSVAVVKGLTAVAESEPRRAHGGEIDAATFEPLKHRIKSLKLETLLNVLKDLGETFTMYVADTHCKECKDVPINVKALAKAKVNKEDVDAVPVELRDAKHIQRVLDTNDDLKVLEEDVAQYRVHCKQRDETRAYLEEYERTMPPGCGTARRDHVNAYLPTAGGETTADETAEVDNQLKNLVIVLKFRTVPAPSPLHTVVLHNFCSDPKTRGTGQTQVCDVQDFHLHDKDASHPGIIKALCPDGLLMAGDRASGFSGSVTKYTQSTYMRKFNYNWRDLHYGAGHGFSEADGAGIKPIKLGEQSARDGDAKYNAGGYKDLVNQSSLTNHFGFEFARHRSAHELGLPDADNLASIVGNTRQKFGKRVSLVQYHWLDRDGKEAREDGIMLTKELVSDKFWTVQSLKLSDQVDMCFDCSQYAQGVERHRTGVHAECVATKSHAKLLELLPSAGDRSLLPQPCTKRFDESGTGALPTPRSGVGATVRLPIGEFPCLLYNYRLGCNKVYYQSVRARDAHMLSVHGEEAIREHGVPVPVLVIAAKSKGLRKPKASKTAGAAVPKPSRTRSKKRKARTTGAPALASLSKRKKPLNPERSAHRPVAANPASALVGDAAVNVLDIAVDEEDDEESVHDDIDDHVEAEDEEEGEDEEEQDEVWDVFAIKSSNKEFDLVRESNVQLGEGQFLGCAPGTDRYTARYALCWQDKGDSVCPEMQNNVQPEGKGVVVAWETSWDEHEVITAVELDKSGKLTQQSAEDIRAALTAVRIEKNTARVPPAHGSASSSSSSSGPAPAAVVQGPAAAARATQAPALVGRKRSAHSSNDDEEDSIPIAKRQYVRSARALQGTDAGTSAVVPVNAQLEPPIEPAGPWLTWKQQQLILQGVPHANAKVGDYAVYNAAKSAHVTLSVQHSKRQRRRVP